MSLENPNTVELQSPVRQADVVHPRRVRAFIALAAAAALAAAIAGFSGSGALGPVIPGGHADAISNAEVAALWSSLAGLTLRPQPAQLDDARSFARAVAGMREPPVEAERLIRAARAEGRRIAILTLWDNMDEDGDIVDVRIGAQSWTVPLRTDPVALTVIYTPGEAITLSGRVDGGGGGVTAAIGLNTGPLPLPPLAVGQSVTLPLE
jgi:hypothetical protein